LCYVKFGGEERACAMSSLGGSKDEVDVTDMEVDQGGYAGSLEEDAEEEQMTEDEVVPVTYQDNETIQILSEDEPDCPMSPSFKKKVEHPDSRGHVGGGRDAKAEVKGSLWDEDIKGVAAFDHTKCGKHGHGTPQTPGILSESPLSEKKDVVPQSDLNKDEQMKVNEDVQEEIKSDEEEKAKGKASKGTFQVGEFPGGVAYPQILFVLFRDSKYLSPKAKFIVPARVLEHEIIKQSCFQNLLEH